MLEQLQKLGELKKAGVLTEAEFQAQKAKILARLTGAVRAASPGSRQCTVNLPVPAAQVVGLGSLAGIARVLGLEADNATIRDRNRKPRTDSCDLRSQNTQLTTDNQVLRAATPPSSQSRTP